MLYALVEKYLFLFYKRKKFAPKPNFLLEVLSHAGNFLPSKFCLNKQKNARRARCFTLRVTWLKVVGYNNYSATSNGISVPVSPKTRQ